MTVKLKNMSDKTRNISVFPAVNFELEGFEYPRYYGMARTCISKYYDNINGIYCSSDHPYAPHDRYNGFLVSSEKIAAYDANLQKFLGPLGSFARPETILNGSDCSDSSTADYNLGAVLQNKVELQPGEEKVIHFIYGLSESITETEELTEELFEEKDAVNNCFKKTKEYLTFKYDKLSIKTPDEKVNNISAWLKKQVDFCLVSKAKKGVRDSLQIANALMMYRPKKAKAEILEVLRHQFQDGHAVLTWYPYDDTRYSDQPFWIVWAIIELIKETGDFTILDIELEYQDGGKGTVLEHIKRGINRLLEDKGPNGLTKIFFADWNDALNVTDDRDAESVMLSEQLCLVLKEMSQLSSRLDDREYTEYLLEQYNEMKKAINKKAWSKNYYSRALSSKGDIGSWDIKDKRIYVNSQIWAVMADIPDQDRLPIVLETLDEIEHDFGFPINTPAYEEYSKHVGRMSVMLPGNFENGGVYCHATAFKLVMDCKVGDGDKALKTLHKIMPDSEENPYTVSQTEPFVFTNCYSLNPHCYGKADRSWRTGTSAWVMKGLYEGIMGIQKDYDGLRVNPCFPSEWDEAEVDRTFRGCKYHIKIRNFDDTLKDKTTIKVDGKEVNGNLLPLFNDNRVHQVEVIINQG